MATITINENEFKKILEDYFQNKDTQISYKTIDEEVGMYDQVMSKTHITMIRKINICGTINQIEEELNEDDILEIFKELLGDTYEVASLYMKHKYIDKSEWDMSETKIPVFAGIELMVKEKNCNKLKKIRA